MQTVVLEAQSERAEFVPDLGCQCVGYRIGSLDVIDGPRSHQELLRDPFTSGIPILFPWPGRIAGGKFAWRGREYAVPLNEGHRGNALHGLIFNRKFAILRRGPYYLQCVLNSDSDSELTRIWPHRFALTLDYEIGNGLRLTASVTNHDVSPMPFGFGVHPYFRLPLDPSGHREKNQLELSASHRWRLNENLIPIDPPDAVSGKYDFNPGRDLGSDTYDDVFGGLSPSADGRYRARLIEPARRIALNLTADADFGTWVIYAPAGRGTISIEPYSCAPNALNHGAGYQYGPARELAPGESWQGRIEISISAL